MMEQPLPLTRDVVLVGGGHTHALVLRKWGMDPLPGARLTLIHPGATAPYSGMLPGFVAGHYDRDALDIDLVRLAQFAGARLINGAASHLDLARREVHVPGRAPVGFDLCALNVGITSWMPDLPGFAAHGVPAKPLGGFAAGWSAYLDRDGAASVAVLGGGVAGVELILAMAHALRSRGRAAELTLIDRSDVLGDVDARSRARLRRALEEAGITVLDHAPVAEVAANHVRLTDGRCVPASFTTGAAGARAQGWLGTSGLELQDGYVTVNPQLQSSDPAVFATGDCAHLAYDPRPKAGVYAVRQAPVLFDNLRAALSGGQMRAYRPQKNYLKLISMGGKRAVGTRLGLSLSGAGMWRWKDRIDRRFMDQFRDLPVMKPPALPALRTLGVDAALGDKPLCGGCGAKVARAALLRGVEGHSGAARDDVTPLPGDDAALLRTGGARQVFSTDHLRALTADPVLMTRIAALHALGDIWAMGASPQAAVATLILPRLSPDLQQRTLDEIMATADAVMREAGAAIVGGHSSVGAELTIGFSLTGLCPRDPLTLAGAQAGDALILTKPLGSGVLMAAAMAGTARGADVLAAFHHMTRAQGAASDILAPAARAMTDVTGFGLAGHLQGICAASGTGAALDLDALPVMEGAVALAGQGIRSTIYAENRALVPSLPEGGVADLLYDPQTAGGLLAAVPQAQAQAGAVLEALQRAGYPAARIGEITAAPGQIVAGV